MRGKGVAVGGRAESYSTHLKRSPALGALCCRQLREPARDNPGIAYRLYVRNKHRVVVQQDEYPLLESNTRSDSVERAVHWSGQLYCERRVKLYLQW